MPKQVKDPLTGEIHIFDTDAERSEADLRLMQQRLEQLPDDRKKATEEMLARLDAAMAAPPTIELDDDGLVTNVLDVGNVPFDLASAASGKVSKRKPKQSPLHKFFEVLKMHNVATREQLRELLATKREDIETEINRRGGSLTAARLLANEYNKMYRQLKKQAQIDNPDNPDDDLLSLIDS